MSKSLPRAARRYFHWHLMLGMLLVTSNLRAAALPDLTIASVTFPSTAAIGSTQTFTAVVQNLGTTAAGAFRLGFYYSTSSAINTSDNLIGTCSFTGLAAGASTTCSGPLPVPSTLNSGAYWGGAIADDLDQVVESNKSNNALATSSSVSLTPALLPDLTITSVTFPSTAAIGSTQTFTAVVQNIGTAAAGAFRLGFYYSISSTITTSGTSLGSCSFTGLATGASTTCSGPLPVPTTLNVGTYWGGAIADDLDQVVESNKSNNTLATSSPISLTQGNTAQTITFNALPSVTFGAPPLNVVASSTSGLTVTFTSTTTAICTVAAVTVTIVGAGTCTIAANQAGNAAYAPAATVMRSFIVSQATQTINFGTLQNVNLGSAPFALSASATSGLPVSFTSATTTVCTVSGSTVTILAVGTCTITASQAGNTNYASAPSVTRSFSVSLSTNPTWTPLVNQPNFYPDTALLLTNGVVLVHENCSGKWHKLTPDNSGSYINGTWSLAGSMPSGYGPLYFSSAVMIDGRVVVIGGEYNDTDSCNNEAETNLGAVYDPVADTWTSLAAPAGWSSVGDSPNVVLPGGQFVLGNNSDTRMASLDPVSSTWTALKGSNKADRWSGEEGWTLLPNGTVLTVDTNNGTQSERYTAANDSWALAGSTVANLATGYETGPAVLRPDGTVFAAGALGHTAVFNTANGTWAAGPDFPLSGGVQLAVADGPAALLPNGNVLVGASPFTPPVTWPTPTLFFEFDGTHLNAVPSPPHASTDATYYTRMLPLPTGQVLFSDDYQEIVIYTPLGQASPSWAPTISNAPTSLTTGQTYTITGTQFNGLSQASAYGDDVQNATNYPLVRITNTATGHVFYCRTHGHSTMAVATGSTAVSTSFDVGAIETGASTLVVVANGIASSPAAVTVAASGSLAQTISFVVPGNMVLGSGPFALSANSSSGLPVSFVSTTTSVCTVSGGNVTIVGTGTCSITASQAGNSTYAAAKSVTIAFAVTAAPPTVVSVSPSAGSGNTQTFAVTISDPGGVGNIGYVYLNLNTTLSTTNSCFVEYNAVTNSVRLANDSGSAWSASSAGGTGTALSNARCTVYPPGFSTSIAGNNLTVGFALGFANYPQTDNVYVQAIDLTALTSGWQMEGTWTIPVPGPPSVVSVSPGSGSGGSQTFAVTASDTGGTANLGYVYMVMSSSLTGTGSCYLQYNAVANTIQLANDAGTAWSAASVLGSGGALSNSQCAVNAAASSVNASGNNLTANLDLTLAAGYAGSKNVYVQAYDLKSQSSGWQMEGTWTVPATGPPSLVSVTPASGSGSSQTFAVAVSDAAGTGSVGYVYMVVSSSLTGTGSCYLQYNAVTNTIQLANDAGTAWSATSPLGGGAALSNSQCGVNAAASSMSVSGNSLTASLALTFSSVYAGSKNVYVQAYDLKSQTSGWQTEGTWIATAPTGTPSVVSVTPSSGSGSSQTFAVTVGDTAGNAAVGSVGVVINGSLSGSAGCWMFYNRAAGTVQLANDGGSAWLSPAAIGAGSTLSNSQCSLNLTMTTVTTSGNQVTLNLPMTFTVGFVGAKTVFVNAADDGGTNTGWQPGGSWTVTASTGTPSVVSVSPSSGTGSSQTFAVTVGDSAGTGALNSVSVVVNASLSGSASCWLLYNKATGTVQLANDAGTAWLGPTSIGASSTLSNSQCALNVAGTSFSTSGNNLTLNLLLTFTAAFAGSKSVFVDAADNGGTSTGWLSEGSWTVNAASGTPSVVSVNPSSGSGLSQTFAVTVADTGGTGTIGYAYVVVDSTLSGTGSCYLQYNQVTNTVQVANDAGTAWSATSTLGSGATLSNSQCSVNAAASSVIKSGNNLIVSLALTFAAGYAGSKNVYLQAYDLTSQTSGWQTGGTWSVP